MNLDFYTRPFKKDDFDYVYDAKNNPLFKFKRSIDNSKKEEIILALNSINHEPITEKEITINGKELFIDNVHIITFNDLHNLLCHSSHNLPVGKAHEIQSNFIKYFISKVSSFNSEATK